MLECASCQTKFSYSPEFLKKVSPEQGTISPPTICPSCRMQRRLTFRNERTYYKRKCDLTGQSIMSIYSPEAPVTVYEHKAWYSDAWNPLDYGVDYDPSQSFFEQFFSLQKKVPLMSLDVKSDNQNCDYSNLVSASKDCYQVVACSAGEECMYSSFLQRNRNVIDCFFIFDSELCYECIDCYSCYDLKYSSYCNSCSESYYLEDCKSSQNCFACIGLSQAKFKILNQQYSEPDYFKQIELILSDKTKLVQTLLEFSKLKEVTPIKYYAGFQNENFTGDHLHYCKNTFNCFDVTYLEDCEHCIWFHKSKDCQDCYGWGLGGELSYECHLVGNTFSRVLFSDSCWNGVSNLTYCRLCLDGSKDLFGCVGVRGQQYCILNKQYSKEDYDKLVSQIIQDMTRRGEWGEFFPSVYSPFAYNETVASEYFPLPKYTVEALGLSWRESLPYTTGKETIKELPKALDKSILKEVLACQSCQRNYKIVEMEYNFYLKQGLPIPSECFSCRHLQRQHQRNSRKLNNVSCSNCKTDLKTTYKSGKILCESCYYETQ